ncbi:MAG: cation-translocating P-type ATPase [Haliscomenobacteraceae bacterium CHB4]|nr:Calcium-transporting ATPase 1 [Saprospiraceae bacterium]MCE7924657.1 cation-translocating P-type ATPase [Haliscomenobacteraceae bacterium CHB4]
MNWHVLPLKKIYELLDSSALGITSLSARGRLAQYGLNELEEAKKKPWWQLLLRQFADFMILVLVAAAIVSGILGDITDSIVILVIVVVNALIGFVQEYRAEKAMAALRQMAAHNATVIRDGQPAHIPASQLVPGDVVAIEAGNVVPADTRLFEVHNLRVEEASLTGESYAVEKHHEILSGADIPLGDRRNMAYKGTYVTYGRAKGIVVATGMNTELGNIARMLQEEDTGTPLQKRLAAFGKNLSYIILLICAVYFGVGYLRGEEPLLMMLTAISLAVAAIPEALPAVITIALALGARRMVRQNALVRRLPAVETLGSVTFICTDKTGTLTVNKMTVEEIFAGDAVFPVRQLKQRKKDEQIQWLLKAMALCNDVAESGDGKDIGDPTEIAFSVAAKNHAFLKQELEKTYPRVAELPFDSERKCMTTIHRDGDGFVAFSKGALDVLLGKAVGLSKEEKERWAEEGDAMADKGLRVLGFAMRRLTELPDDITHATMERDLTVIGAAGLIDPPREEVKQAVHECKTAGIRPVMITGDYLLTARNIAQKLGIIESENDLVITGSKLAAMSAEEFGQKVEHIRVYARVSPEQKLNIVKALQDKGHFVAMTGDGVNDAPSLKRADIGVAMGITGTDVSKEAADMILLDDNFATIVKAVKQGRRIFDNIRKFIKYIMTGNSGEIWTLVLAPLFGLPIPLLPIHILWINLVSDGLPSIALAAEPSEKGIMKRPPRATGESVFAGGLGRHIIWVGLLMGIVCVATQAFAIEMGDRHWQTMVFSVLSFSQMGHVLAIRSESQSLFRQGLFSNLPLLGAVALTFVLQLATIYIPSFNPIFKTAPLTFYELLAVMAASSVVFWAVEVEKVIRRRKIR